MAVWRQNWRLIKNWANKPLTVSDLLKICKNAVNEGLGDKYVFIPQDEEGNGFHALWYSFTTQVKDYADLIYQVNEEDLENIIILG